jgi:hypothetical protein
MNKMVPKTDALAPLIEMAAQADALWQPIRNWSNPAHVAAVHERREEFYRRGLPYRNGGAGDERKARERQTDAMEDAGLVVCCRNAGKRIGWKLTDIGDWKIRRLCGSYGAGAMLTAMRCLQALEDTWPEEPGVNRTPETWLTGLDYGTQEASRRIVRLAEMFSPAMIRNLVDSHSDSRGRTAYALTSTGREFLQAGNTSPDDRELPAFDPAAGDLYETALDAAQEELKAATPTRENSVVIPLSCGCWPEDSERPPVPPVFTPRGDVHSLASWCRAVRAKIKQITAKAHRQRKPTSPKKEKP